jgi:hypothetical protein
MLPLVVPTDISRSATAALPVIAEPEGADKPQLVENDKKETKAEKNLPHEIYCGWILEPAIVWKQCNRRL